MPVVVTDAKTAQSVLGMLGLAARARQTVMGEQACEDLIRAGGAAVCLLEEDASENAVKRMTDKCSFYHVPLVVVPGGRLGQSVGKPGRKTVCLRPGSFAKHILSLL